MKKKKGSVLITVGVMFLAAAMALAAYNIWDDRRAAEESETILEQVEVLIPEAVTREENEKIEDPSERVIPDYILDPNREMPVIRIDGYEYIGVLDVPSLSLSLPIMSSWDDTRLKISPCRYKGSAYQGNLIIAGHNYKSHFRSLKTFTGGETVIFTDADGNRFTYEVVEAEILDGSDVERMESGEWDLTLFTCTYGGKTRYTLRCELVDSYAKSASPAGSGY